MYIVTDYARRQNFLCTSSQLVIYIASKFDNINLAAPLLYPFLIWSQDARPVRLSHFKG